MSLRHCSGHYRKLVAVNESKVREKSILQTLVVLAICAVVAGLFLRTYNLGNKLCWLDESYTLLRISGFTVEEILYEANTGHISSVADLIKYQKLNKDKNAASTIYASAVEDPHIPPTYYLLERAWCSAFGDSIATVRSLSVVFSLICLPLIWILCQECFASQAVAAIATTLMALSPIQVVYAQEARPYSLWCLVILTLSICFLKAIRTGKFWWLLYALTGGLALWVHPLSILVLVGNAIYSCIVSIKNNNRQLLYPFTLASAVSLILFAPWLYVMISGIETIRARTASATAYQSDWMFDISCPFIDLPTTEFFAILAIAIPLMQLVALVAFIYNKQRKTFLFLACLGLIPTLSLIAPDFFLGGMRSFIPRYLFPLYLSLVISMAYLIAALINSKKQWHCLCGGLFFSFLIIVGLRSDWLMVQERTWWNKQHSNYLIPIADIINHAEQPYLISAAAMGTNLVLSHLIKPDTPIRILAGQPLEALPTAASNIYLLNPPAKLLLDLKEKGLCKMAPQDKNGHLWRLETVK